MELESLMSAFAETLGIEGVEVKDGTCSLTIDYIPMEFTDLDKFVSKAEEWRETVENFRPAAEAVAGNRAKRGLGMSGFQARNRADEAPVLLAAAGARPRPFLNRRGAGAGDWQEQPGV